MLRTKGTGARKPADGDEFALCGALRLQGDFYTSAKKRAGMNVDMHTQQVPMLRALMHVDPRGGLFTQEQVVEAFSIMQQDDGIIKGRATACDDEGSANVTFPLRKHGIF